jgi:hypothetical protein
MSSNQPLPGNTPIAAENFNNGDWSARALEAVRIAIECEDVPEDTEYRAQANSDGREASASPHSDRSSSKREEPPVAWASGLIAPARDRLSFPAIGTSGPGRRRVFFLVLLAAAFGLGWAAGVGYFGQVHLNPVSVSSPPSFTTSAFVPDPGIVSGSRPNGITNKSRRSVLDRKTPPTGGTPTNTAELASQKDVRETAMPLPRVPAQMNPGIRDTMEPLVQTKPKRTPSPDTRPVTIEGWAIREVRGSAALLEGPDGIRSVVAGDTIPGIGRIDSIVRWGNRWLVATSSGLVTTP